MNELSEQCLLGCLLRSPKIWDEIKFVLRGYHFTLSPSKKLFEIFSKWADQNENYRSADSNDFVTYVEAEYQDWIKINSKSIQKCLTLIIDKDQAEEKWSYYLQNLEVLFLNKKSLDVLSTLHNKIEKSPLNTKSIIQEGITDLSIIRDAIISSEEIESLDKVLEIKRQQLINRLDETYAPALSGIKSLDQITNGYFPESYNLIAARSSMGKSSLMGNMVKDMIERQNKKIVVFNLETSNNLFIDRWASTELKIDARLIKEPRKLNKIQREQLFKFYLDFTEKHKNKLFLYDRIYFIDKIIEKIIKLYKEFEIDGVFIDLIGYVKTKESFQNRQLELANISDIFYQFKKQYPKLFITVLQQLNKVGDTASQDSNSAQSAFRESEDPYLQSDNAIIIYPYREDKIKDPNKRIITVDKNRDGATGSTFVSFIKEYLMFSDQNLGESLEE